MSMTRVQAEKAIQEFDSSLREELDNEGYNWDDGSYSNLSGYGNSLNYDNFVDALISKKITSAKRSKLIEAYQEWFAWDSEDPDEDFNDLIEQHLTTFLEEQEVTMPTSTKKSPKKEAVKKVLKKVADTVIDDSKTVAIRMAAKKAPQLITEPFIQLLVTRAGLPDDSSIKGKIRAFLESDFGAAMISMMFSGAIELLPLPEGSAKDSITALSKEMRLNAMTTVAEPAVDLLLIPIKQLTSSTLSQLSLPGFDAPKSLPQATTSTTLESIKASTKKSTTKKSSSKKKEDSGITVKVS